MISAQVHFLASCNWRAYLKNIICEREPFLSFANKVCYSITGAFPWKTFETSLMNGEVLFYVFRTEIRGADYEISEFPRVSTKVFTGPLTTQKEWPC